MSNHSHYFKDVSHLKEIDVYRVIELFNITDPCLQHAIKKLLVPGKRGAGKDMSKDVQEVIDSCERWKRMQEENAVALKARNTAPWQGTPLEPIPCWPSGDRP